MLRPTLIVGLGTSGLTVVSEVQKLMYETFGVNRLPIFNYVYIETDLSKSHEQTPAGSDLVPVKIHVESLERACRDLRNNPQLSLDWVPPDLPQHLAYNAQGAGGVRPAGRLLLWGDQVNRNFMTAYDAIAAAWADIRNPAANAAMAANHADIVARAGGLSPQPVVYVVGTLVGGTCSGCFIDIGYVLRRITGLGEQGAMYAVLFVPGEGLTLHAGYGNTYGALVELDYFRTPGHYYQEVWPNEVRVPPERLPPYSIVYLISSEYGRHAFAGMSFDGCLKVAGLKLFCDLAGLSSHRGATLADGMNEGFGFYATFGISAVLYPKYALMEAMGCEQGKALCDRWLMVGLYQPPTGSPLAIVKKTVFEEADQFLADALRGALAALSQTGQRGSLVLDIREDIDRILRREEGRPVNYIDSRFRAGTPGNYYSAVSDNLSAARDQLIRAIRDFVYEKMRHTENLDYTKVLLRQIELSLQQTLAYWDRCGIPKAVSEWNEYVSSYARRMFHNQQTWLGQRRSELEDRAESLLARLKMFCLRQVLGTLQSSLERGSLATADQSAVLPTVEQVERARKNMQDAREALDRRAAAIAAEVADTSVPIRRVWHSGSFDADCANLRQAYSARYGVPSLADVTRRPAWDFLTTTQGLELFALVKVGYQVRFREFLPSVNVIEEATRDPQLTREYAERALAGLLRLDPPARAGQAGIPRYVLGSDPAALNHLVTALRQQGLQDLQPNHVRPMPLLDHSLVFYEEKCGVNPFAMLEAGETLKYYFEHPAVDSAGIHTVDPGVWKKQRLAYNIEGRSRVAHCMVLIDFILDFVLKWDQAITGEWEARQTRWPSFPLTPGAPPRFWYVEAGGPKREFALDSDLRKVRELASRPADIEALDKAVNGLIGQVGLDALTQAFDREIRPYLAARFSEAEMNRRTDFYFGQPGRNNGFIHLRLAACQAQATGN